MTGNKLENLPRFERLSRLDKFPNLSHADAELNVFQTNNFGYYTVNDFQASEVIKQSFLKDSFSIFNCNIRSLAANYDNLATLLSNLEQSFNIISLSETKIKNETPITNLLPPGYEFISQPTLTNAGGVGLYIKHDMNFTIREDLNIVTPQYESLWIEINCDCAKNIICGVIYRHPSGNLQLLINDYIYSVVDKIARENKHYVFMGDFNINLLNFESCTYTNEFINSLGSYCISPQILQPSQITAHPATLIDNIFLSSTEQQGGISFSTNQCVCLHFRSQPIRMQESQNCQQSKRENIAVFSRFAASQL